MSEVSDGSFLLRLRLPSSDLPRTRCRHRRRSNVRIQTARYLGKSIIGVDPSRFSIDALFAQATKKQLIDLVLDSYQWYYSFPFVNYEIERAIDSSFALARRQSRASGGHSVSRMRIVTIERTNFSS